MSELQSISKLVSIIKRKEQIYFHQKLNRMELHHGQVKIFKYLGKNEGATQQDITDFFQLKKSSTSYLIKKMVNQGYVRKVTDPDDRRSQRLYLTDKGLKKFKVLKREIFGEWSEQLLKGFSADEKKKIVEFMNRMVTNVNFVTQHQKKDEK